MHRFGAAGEINGFCIDINPPYASVGLCIAASGGVAASIIGAVIILFTNSVTAEISGSTISDGTNLNVKALSDSKSTALTVVLLHQGPLQPVILSGNIITNTVTSK
jgi:hypothetical protein